LPTIVNGLSTNLATDFELLRLRAEFLISLAGARADFYTGFIGVSSKSLSKTTCEWVEL